MSWLQRDFLVNCLLEGGETEGCVVVVEGDAEGFDGEVVVFALGEAGDGDSAYDACSGDGDRDAAAVGGVVGVGEAVLLVEGGAVVLELEAERVGAAVEAGDHVGFALDPACVVGRGAG